ncbi:small integral membrane protein 5 [Python bivittatus]|uniref:Small integral membrane protein 5 n=1 Tax=Python bivittatus TaxID=176946 RepID=A0A9F5MRN3_PYTBI|nr:small integral membrane protein 5 [Python bivittatus]XP_015743778.1 small integral membrane protein 5 [Python bivittatus]XP_025023193.1 small integral membrane protein 5 [Python bivittatus]XP_025023194.1 small integral membrane protein 5 [Python bivittatus]XP_025023195.1 small integral membrane protein 5 [Python bivittatus]
MSFKQFQKELSAIGYKLWLKLQRLPKAEPLEIVCFFIIVLFIATMLSMMIIACSFCCSRCGDGSPKPKGKKIHVQPAAHL